MTEYPLKGRDRLYDLATEGVISRDTLVIMVCKWMTSDDIEEMLDANELSARFMEDDEEGEDNEHADS